ncbi:hypothetical protein, unlikely [Trypanosoma brucei brucei TREU927]|uniref:Uncharacterized protein n=1 Tax=Trypanosoma brucei brucei (strain 927/4 GUTat10.1) TaxID=185431 RepID=Q38EC8_TRYB2|nr:hypothetical protein, unlikely [Trypanosoma brucei brucei TREU927]EAN76842.1 hypothetical protein, unlikely [Trypanosoma brucei brucei TREU927]
MDEKRTKASRGSHTKKKKRNIVIKTTIMYIFIFIYVQVCR